MDSNDKPQIVNISCEMHGIAYWRRREIEELIVKSMAEGEPLDWREAEGRWEEIHRKG